MGALPIPKRLRNNEESLQTVAKLKTPRKVQNSSTSVSEVTARRTITSVGCLVKENGRLKSSGRSAHCKVPRTRKQYDTVEEVLQDVQQRARKPAGLLLNDKGELSQKAFTAYWVRTVREHYPGALVAGFTLKEFCMFRNMVKSSFDTITPADLITYLVAEWKHLLKEFVVTSAKWRASDIPDIQSVVKHWRTIRPLMVTYFSEDAIRARNNAGSLERAKLKSYEDKVHTVADLSKQVEVQRATIAKLEAERAEVYHIAAKRGISITAERARAEASKAKTRKVVELHNDLLEDDDELPEWK